MDNSKLGDQVIDLLGRYLCQTNTDEATAYSTKKRFDEVYSLVSACLARTSAGRSAMQAFYADPKLPMARLGVKKIILAALKDNDFAKELDSAVRRVGVSPAAPPAPAGSLNSSGQNNQAIKIDGASVHIGKIVHRVRNSSRPSKIGIAGGVAALVIAIFGGLAKLLVHGDHGTPVTVAQVVGAWQHQGSTTQAFLWTVKQGPIVIQIKPNGKFTFSDPFSASSSSGSADPNSAVSRGLNALAAKNIGCSGSGQVSPDGQHYAFQMTSGGSCPDFTATLSSGGRTLVVLLGGAHPDTIALSRIPANQA